MKLKHTDNQKIHLSTVLLLICIYGFVLYHFHLPASIRHYSMEAPEELTSYYESDKLLVELSFDILHYTGIDYFQDNTKLGSYYYYEIPDGGTDGQLFKNRYILVLIKTTTGQEALKDYHCRCRIFDGGERMETVLSALSSVGGIRYTDMEQMFQPLILSEVDYPGIFITATYLFLVLAAVGIVICLISALSKK